MSENRSLACSIPLAALASIAFLVSACSEGEGNRAEPAAQPPTSEAASGVGACDLLTAEEAAAALGGAVGDPKAGAPMNSDSVRLTDCTWIDTESGRSITLILRRSETSDNTAEAIAGIRAELASAGPVDNVDGLGESAFWGAGQLHVFKGGRDYLTVSVAGFGDADARSSAREVAESAIGRL